MNFISRSLFSAVLVVSAASLSCAAQTVRPVQGPVILARSGSHATYLWDASSYVAQLVQDKDVAAPGLQALEATALTALVAKARTSHAQLLEIHVLYSRTGAVSPVYGTATFTGVENVFMLIVSRADAMRNGERWAQSLAGGKSVPQVKLKITGQLPQPQ